MYLIERDRLINANEAVRLIHIVRGRLAKNVKDQILSTARRLAILLNNPLLWGHKYIYDPSVYHGH